MSSQIKDQVKTQVTEVTMSSLDKIRIRFPFLVTMLDIIRIRAQENKRLLKILGGLVLVYGINKALTVFARNHWRIFKQGTPWRLNEEIALVTGGCSGFGYLTVLGLVPKLWKVVVVDVADLPDDLQKLTNVAYYKCDITNPEAVEKMAADVRKEHGGVSILINNAGIAASHTILDTKPDYLEKIFKVNVLSHYYLIQQFLPHMLEAQKGHILALASMASYCSTASLVDYSATKHAVLALHNGLNQELKHRYQHGRCIQTSIVHPMWARTPLVNTWKTSLMRNKPSVLSPVLEPHQVADAVVNQILSGRSGQVYVPGKFSLASGLHGWPQWMQEIVNDGNQALTDSR